MSSARVDYIAPWWTYWLHNFPHVNLRLQPAENTFRPQDEDYQQSLMFLFCVAAAGLGLNLLGLAVYLSCLCCCKREEEAEETKKPNSCCVTWAAVAAGLLSCVAVGVGFYGNSETNDGVYQLTYSLYNANHTLSGVENLVTGTMGGMQSGLKDHLSRLDEIFATRGDFVQTLQFMQQMSDNIIKQLLGLPDWEQAKVDLAAIADQTAFVEYYRWLTYLLILILDLIICLAACLGLDYLDALMGVCYDGVEGLLYLCLFSLLAAGAFCTMLCAIPRAWRQIANRERDYDDIDEEDPFNPRVRRMGSQNAQQANLHSFCSYSSSMGSQNSLHPPVAPATSNAPVTEYMNQTALFGGNPRYENVPLIGRGSPPPSYSPSMRATYLSMTEDQMRHFGEDFRA
uniref:Protein tweety homolog n=1 Tax=Astyanax mexicanus TaxID=7994 RepID=A0A8B9H9W0_ASTMX